MLLAGALALSAADTASHAEHIVRLIDPAKLERLGERGADPRVQKYVARVAEARRAGIQDSNVVGHNATADRTRSCSTWGETHETVAGKWPANRPERIQHYDWENPARAAT